jgi:hypothetical protein
MLPRSLIGYLTVFSLSVGFAPVQAVDSPAVTAAALQLKQAQQKNSAFLTSIRNTPRLSEAEIAKLSKVEQNKYRTALTSLNDLVAQLEQLDAENLRLGGAIQAATIKSAELDKKIDPLRPAALQANMNRPNPTVTVNPLANSPRFMTPPTTPAAAPTSNPAANGALPSMRPSMPPESTSGSTSNN